MKAYLRIWDGGRSGARFPLHPDRPSVLGRAPGVEIHLDPHADLAVSGRHAEFSFRDGRWWVRDLESRNGTFVDGRRIERPTPLKGGSVLRFAADGPRVRFELGESDTGRVRQEGRRKLVGLATTAGVLLLAVGLVALSLLQRERGERARLFEERTELHVLVDSLLEREAQVTGALSELDDALALSRGEVERLRGQLESGQERAGAGTDAELDQLHRELEEAVQALARQQLAATLDFPEIEGANRPAVAMIFVENADGRVVSGTGFSVSEEAYLVTARHILEDAGGRLEPRRVAVQFSDSRQVWAAEVVAASQSVDLAVLRVASIEGAVPTVRGIGSNSGPLQSGMPVAVLGFPLGGSVEPGFGGARPPARPLLSAGVISEVSLREFLVQGYGEPGASGSPVLDEAGRVVGVVQGGERTARGGILVVVPSADVRALLAEAGIGVP
ncbi:MAG: FHA domain-containing protein [Gemmatimonadales bacterium]|nr:MAG: FHA domain-containing protein [Gemmatimonadales bacterium]